MQPVTVPDVVVYAGDNTDFGEYIFKTGSTPINMVAAGWTNWDAQWRSKSAPNSPVELTLDTTALNVGSIKITIDSGISRAMAGPGTWDLQAKRSSDGFIQTFVVGKTTWKNDVTRNADDS